MSAQDPSGRDLPLLQWGEALRREAAERARLRRLVLLWLLAFWAVLLNIVFPPAPRLVWNASASAPIGLYRVSPGTRLATGDMVIAWLPKRFRHVAATRRYLPENVPLVKRIAGVPGDRICAVDRAVLVNGHRVAARLATDRQGRTMPWWTGCRALHDGEYFLLMAAVPASFDGRYFGGSRRSDIIGKATLLWSR
jgi:conjugative transfer signal peptidase TraF